MERKYFFEAGLNVYTSYKTIIPIEHLKSLEKVDNRKYHIYAILALPKIYFKKEKTYVDKHALLMVKKMHDEGDCISDDGITIVF